MSSITSCRVVVFIAGVVFAAVLIGAVVAAGVTGLWFGAQPGEAASKPLKTAFARVLFDDNADGEFFEKSRGVVDVVAVEGAGGRVYCFDLAFVPKVAAGSAFFTNNATVAVWLPDQSGGTGCPETHRDAAARTLAGNTSEQRADINFNIIFHG
jgi:hypothetical protein